jgi:hypothetical protein
MHQLTHVMYRITGQMYEPKVQFSLDGTDWLNSSEYANVRDFVDDIRKQNMTMQFVPEQGDLDGVNSINNACAKALAQLHGQKIEHETKHSKGLREGKRAALLMVKKLCEEYLSRAVTTPAEAQENAALAEQAAVE